LNFISEIATVKYTRVSYKNLPLPIKPQILMYKKLPLKFDIFVRVEMTHLKRQKLLC